MDIRRFGIQEGVNALLDAYEGPSVYQRPPQNPETLALLEALLTKSPGGMLQTTMDTASDIGNVLGSIGQLDKAEALGRQVRRTLPNIVDAVSSDLGGTYDAMAAGLKQGVLDRGLGAVMGVEDVAIPGLSMMSKLGAAGTALGMAATPMGKRTRQQLIEEIAKSGSRPEANKILEASAREYGYDPDLIEATRQYRPTGGPATPTDMFDTVETPSQNASPAARRREVLRSNPELAGYKAGQAPGESILTYDDVSQRPVVQPEEMVGGVLVPMQGDRTDRVLVEQVSGIPLKRPVKVEAGPNFPFGRDDFAWASNYGIVKGFQNKARLAADATGKPVYAGYVAMGADSGNFSTPVIEIMLNQLDAIQIPKKEIQNINRIIDQALVSKGYPKKHFVGIDSPDAIAQLLGVVGPSGVQYPYGGSGQLRKAVIEAVSKKNVYDLGFPSLRDVTYDITQPNLRNVETSDAGATIVRLDPYAPLRDSDAPRDVEHRSYDTGIPGSDMGRMEQVDIPAPIMFPQSYGRAKDMVNKGKSGKPLTQSQQFKNVVSATDQYEVLDQQWLDGVRSWMERTKTKDIGTLPTLAFLLLGAGGVNAMASDDPEMQAAGGAMLGAAAMGGVPKVIRQAGAGAKNAKKAREQQLKEYEDFDYPDAEESIRTQITTTKPTYIKANQYLDDQQAIGKTLDYGAGLGFSKEMLGYDMFEPNTARGEALGVTYDFTDSKAIPDSQYERVVNLNVLNVVSPQVRDFIVEDIARVMKPGGSAIITTRGRDVLNAKGTPGPEPMSLVTSTGTYQKGFTNPELKEYIETVLGEGYDVKSITLGGAGVYVKKKGNQPMTARGARSAELAAEQIARGDNIEAAEYNRLSAESTRLTDRAKAVIQDRLKNNRDREGMYGGEAAKMDEEIARQTEEIDTLVKRQEATIHQEFLNRELDDAEKARFDRAVKQGFDIDAFHGTKGDISIFDPGLLGTTTTAPSARKGFFFAAEPETANAYAKGSDPIDLGRATREDIRRAENDIESEIQKIGDRMAEIEQSVRSKTNFYDKVNDIVDRKSAGALSNSEAEYEMDLLEREIQLEAFNDFAYANMANKKENLIQQRMTAGSKIGNNIMPVKLRIQNPFEYDFKGLSYRDISYDSLIDRAKEAGHDGAIFRNTKDGGPVTDVYVVFDPAQIRSRFATFDPDKMGSSDILASVAPVLYPVGAGAAAAAYTVNNE